MKKLSILIICFLLASTSIVTAAPTYSISNLNMQTKTVFSSNGTFMGSIGVTRQGNWTEVGSLNGNYQIGNRFGRFNGEWSIQLPNQNATGTMRGIFLRYFLLGRINVDGTGRTLPIIGFIGFNDTALTFRGRFMSLAGPALYFRGTYT